MIQDDRTAQKLVIYRGQVMSKDIRSVFEGYDPRIRPWYAPVAESRSPMWSSIYANADERQEITLSALTPVYQQQAFQGVVVTDVKIDTFNTFLKHQQERTNAAIYLFDTKQRLVAHSTGGSVVSWGTPLSDKGQRLLATESSNPIVQTSAQYAFEQGYHASQETNRFSININGARYFNHITPYTCLLYTSPSPRDRH